MSSFLLKSVSQRWLQWSFIFNLSHDQFLSHGFNIFFLNLKGHSIFNLFVAFYFSWTSSAHQSTNQSWTQESQVQSERVRGNWPKVYLIKFKLKSLDQIQVKITWSNSNQIQFKITWSNSNKNQLIKITWSNSNQTHLIKFKSKSLDQIQVKITWSIQIKPTNQNHMIKLKLKSTNQNHLNKFKMFMVSYHLVDCTNP